MGCRPCEEKAQEKSRRMSIRWTPLALSDVGRLSDFIGVDDPNLAQSIEDMLVAAPRMLLKFPRRGTRLDQYRPREVRELPVRRYRMRYELTDQDIFILRFFHGREDRGLS